MSNRILMTCVFSLIGFIGQGCSNGSTSQQSLGPDLKSQSPCESGNCALSKSSLANQIIFQNNLIQDELADYYDLYLQREPDQPGLEFWSQHVAQGNVTMSQAKGYIKDSPEAKSLPPLPDYQFIPEAHRETSCTVRVDGQETPLSSAQGYITRFVRNFGLSYPKKGYYKLAYTEYCIKQRVRCWAGQSRARVVNIKVLGKGQSCNEEAFANKPETSYAYIKKLNEDLSEVYNQCHDREPSRQEIDESLTSILEHNSSLYEVASSVCKW